MVTGDVAYASHVRSQMEYFIHPFTGEITVVLPTEVRDLEMVGGSRWPLVLRQFNVHAANPMPFHFQSLHQPTTDEATCSRHKYSLHSLQFSDTGIFLS